MRQLFLWLLGLSGLSFAVACSAAAPVNSKLVAKQQVRVVKTSPVPVNTCRVTSPFSSVVVNGKFTVKLSGQRKVSSVRLTGNRQLFASIGCQVKHDVLTITAVDAAESFAGVTVNIKTSSLQRLEFLNGAKVHASHIKAKRLAVIGNANSQAEISGSVQQLDVTLKNYARLNADRVMVNDAYIYTTGDSVAQVQVKNVLTAIAADESNIYYFLPRPKELVKYMRNHGTVLGVNRLKWVKDHAVSVSKPRFRNKHLGLWTKEETQKKQKQKH